MLEHFYNQFVYLRFHYLHKMHSKAVNNACRNSETLGFDGFISYWNYWLLLFFILSGQVALNLQWFLVQTAVVLHIVQDGTILKFK